MKINTDLLETLIAEYFDPDFIQLPDYKYYRQDFGGRYYIKQTDEEIIISPSTTTVVKKCSSMSWFLIEWYAKEGIKYCKWHLEQSANYGTFMHIMYNKIILGEKIFLSDALLVNLESWCSESGNNYIELKKWYDQEKRDIKKDLYAFFKWVQDYKIKPLAIEFPLIGDDYAGMIDLVAKITYRHKEFVALIDYKTGKSFYEDHAIQLAAYKQLWDEQFPERKIDKIFNFRPKQFKLFAKTFYEFKDQTKSYGNNIKKFNLFLELFKLDNKIDINYTCSGFDPNKEISINSDLDGVIVENKIIEEYGNG
jgi:hypothetical protein